jgi:hypothetical protein
LIGGEGLSSIGNTGQGGEREEVAIGGFQRKKSTRKSRVIQNLLYDFSCISMGHNRYSHGYPWVIEGKVMDFHGSHKGKLHISQEMCQSRSYNNIGVSRFVYNV